MDGFHHLLFRNSHLQGIRLVLALLDAATGSPDPPGGKGWKMWKNIWENPGESWKDVSKFGIQKCGKKCRNRVLSVDNSGAHMLSIHDFKSFWMTNQEISGFQASSVKTTGCDGPTQPK